MDALVLTLVFVPLGLVSLFGFNLDPDDYSAWVIYYFHMPLFGAMAWWALEGRIPRTVFWAFAAAMVGGIAYRWNLGFDYKKSLDLAVALIAGVRSTWWAAAGISAIGSRGGRCNFSAAFRTACTLSTT